MKKTPQTLTEDQLAGIPWTTSSFSQGGNTQCVEAGPIPGGGVAVRHSHWPEGAVLVFDDDEWTAFRLGIKADEFDF